MAQRDEIEKLDRKFDNVLTSLGEIKAGDGAMLASVKAQGDDLDELKRVVEVLRNGKDGDGGLPHLHGLLEQRVLMLERIIFFGGGGALLALLTSLFFWKSILRGLLRE